MDVENPLQIDDIPIAKMVCIEVMGEPASDEMQEHEPIYNSYQSRFLRGLSNFLFCVLACTCFLGLLFYVFVFPL
jgi:hypothetical protein